MAKALCGLIAAPKSRRPSRRARRANGADGRFLGEHHAVEALVGLAQFGEAAAARVGALPVEGAAVDQQAADGGAVPAQEFGGRVEHQVGAVVEGRSR
jgi:hypothetical protein